MNVSCMKDGFSVFNSCIRKSLRFYANDAQLSQLASSLLPGETVGQQDRKPF